MLAISAHDTAGQFAGLWHIYLGVTLAVGIVVTGAIIVVAMRFRRRPGRAARDLHSAPRVEGAYLAVIVAIVICLLAFTYRTENNVDALVSHPAVRVDVTASQWQWRFRYPAAGIVMTARDVGSSHPHLAHLVVPAGKPVEFSMRSADVLHSLFIPEMRFKRYAYPNYENRFVLTFPHPGRMLGECAQLCGWDHAEMRFDVDVLSVPRFRAWIAAHRAAAG